MANVNRTRQQFANTAFLTSRFSHENILLLRHHHHQVKQSSQWPVPPLMPMKERDANENKPRRVAKRGYRKSKSNTTGNVDKTLSSGSSVDARHCQATTTMMMLPPTKKLLPTDLVPSRLLKQLLREMEVTIYRRRGHCNHRDVEAQDSPGQLLHQLGRRKSPWWTALFRRIHRSPKEQDHPDQVIIVIPKVVSRVLNDRPSVCVIILLDSAKHEQHHRRVNEIQTFANLLSPDSRI